MLYLRISAYALDIYSEFNSLYKTGDIPLFVYIILLIVSLVGIYALIPKRKKHKKNKNISKIKKNDKHVPKRLK